MGTPALKNEDSVTKLDRRANTRRITSEDGGEKALGSPLFEAGGLSQACRAARKKLIHLCYQVCAETFTHPMSRFKEWISCSTIGEGASSGEVNR